jgi:hypothetical protein
VRTDLLAGLLVLAGACASSLPAPRPQTLCERPAQPAASAGDPAVEASFRAFARDRLERLRIASAATGRDIGEEFETELRPTGDRAAPWVGVLRYCERRPPKRAVVTELFRFQAGEWVD